MTGLAHLAATVRDAPGLRAKRELRLLDRLPFAVDGDDAAVVAHGDGQLVLCGEAIAPALLTADPFAAGAAAVATNVADVRAMGGRPLGLIDTLISPDRAHADRVLDGLAWAADRLGVAVVGGHLTLGGPPALSAFCAGSVKAPLRAGAARPGDVLLAAFCLDGEQRDTEPPIFTSLRDRDPALLRDDGEALVEVAERGLCHAARDVSMPGVAGSLLQMLELAGVRRDARPRPPSAPRRRRARALADHLPELRLRPRRRAREAPRPRARPSPAAGWPARRAAPSTTPRVLRLAGGDESAEVWDLAAEPLTRARLRGIAIGWCAAAVEGLRVAVAPPAERLEERDVGHLDHRHHPRPAARARRGDGEAHEPRAERPVAHLGQHGQAVALPVARAQRIEPHGPGDPAAGDADRVQRRRHAVALVTVVAGEHLLLVDEDRAAHRVVRREIAPAAAQPHADYCGPRRRDGRRGHASAPSRRRAPTPTSPEHAWQRAQPAPAAAWSRSAPASIADTER